MVMDPSFYRAADSDMDSSGSAAQAMIPPWSQVTSLATQIGLLLTTFLSPVLHLFMVPTSSLLFRFHFSTTYLLLLVVPRVSECPELPQE